MTQRVPLLLDRIRAAIARDPAAPAFLGRDTISYGAMRTLIGSGIRLLDERGVRAGQVVALTMSQSSLHLILFLALVRMGAIPISVAPMKSASERTALYRRFGITTVVSEYTEAGAPGVALIHVRTLSARGDEPQFDNWPFEPVASTPMRIALTSGTVGERKGIEQSHEEFVTRMDRRGYGDEPRPRVLPPNLHITLSLTLACHALARGGAVVIPPGYDADSLFTAIAKFGVTHFTFPPAHAAMMLQSLKSEKPAFPNVTFFDLIGGTPSPALVELIRRKFTPHVFVSYATAETGLIAMATPEILATAICAGRIAPGTELQVIGEDGRVLPPGEPGEIRVRVPAMPRGYVGGADADRFRDGWIHPRDIGHVTEEGLVYVQGRIDEILNVGGRKASPGYVEAMLEESPWVREAAVFALDGMSLGAIVATKGPADWRALDASARRRLDVFAPRRYYEIAELPRNIMGKIRRGDLPALAASVAVTLRHHAKQFAGPAVSPMTERVPLPLDRIRAAVARDPDAPAFLGTSEISYGTMRSLIGAAIRMLDGRGVRPGQVVALTMSQSPLHVIMFLALARMGAVSLSVAPIADASERAAFYRRFGVAAVVSELEDAGAPVVTLIHVQRLSSIGDEAQLDNWPFEPVASTPLRIALTSGTVGDRKGIEQSHGDFARRLDRRYYGEEAIPRVLPQALFRTSAFTLVCHALTRGGAVVFPPAYDAHSLFATLRRFDITHVTYMPSEVVRMLPLLKGDAPAFPRLTHLRLVGVRPAPGLLEGVRRKFTPHVHVPYSTTETGVIAVGTPEILAERPGSSGRVAPDVEIQIVGEDGAVLPPNTPGEIRVRVPGMPRGYFGGADATRFRDGWFHPGDLGYLGEDRFLYVQGRIDEIIDVGGRKLTPEAAESVLLEHPGVIDAAVFPLDPSSIGAIIVADAPIDWAALWTLAGGRLEGLAPRRYFEAREIPRSTTGKLRRSELRAFAESSAVTLRHPAK